MAASQSSKYLQYLPAIFQRKPADENEPVLGQFLAPFESQFDNFERILAEVDRKFSATLAPAAEIPNVDEFTSETGTSSGAASLMGQNTAQFPSSSGNSTLSRPTFGTPAPADDFLPWLAGWVAHPFDEEWDEDRRRRFLAQAMALYRERGTVAGLKRYLELGLDLDPGEVEIREGRWPGGMQIGVASRIGYVANNNAGEPNGAGAGKPGIDMTSHDYYVVDTVTPTDLPAGIAGESIPDGERIQLYYDADFIQRIDLQWDGVGLDYLERYLFGLGPELSASWMPSRCPQHYVISLEHMATTLSKKPT